MIGRSLQLRRACGSRASCHAVHLRHHDVHQHDVDRRVAPAAGGSPRGRCRPRRSPCRAPRARSTSAKMLRMSSSTISTFLPSSDSAVAVQVLERLPLGVRQLAERAVQGEVDGVDAAARASAPRAARTRRRGAASATARRRRRSRRRRSAAARVSARCSTTSMQVRGLQVRRAGSTTRQSTLSSRSSSQISRRIASSTTTSIGSLREPRSTISRSLAPAPSRAAPACAAARRSRRSCAIARRSTSRRLRSAWR